MLRVYIAYDECEYLWDNKNRYNAGAAFTTKQQMISYAAKRLGITATGHPELREYATRYLKERNILW